MKPKIAAIIVTHNSEKFLKKCINCLKHQSCPPDQIILVDSGSKDKSYLLPYETENNIQVVYQPNDIGFCQGNNIGMQHISDSLDYILLINPDAFLEKNFLEKALSYMERPLNQSCGMLTGKVYGYDIEKDEPSGNYDTTGIFRRWYGHWYDRGKGELVSDIKYNECEYVPAICGALMLVRKKALDSVGLSGQEILDPIFFMYKEDIDLSDRMRKKGWKLAYVPSLIAYHCRGWDHTRKKMPRWVRLLSARNECILHFRQKSFVGMIYSSIKYFSVFAFDI